MHIRPLQMTSLLKWINYFIGRWNTLLGRFIHIVERAYSILRKEVWILEKADANGLNNSSVMFIGSTQEMHYIGRLFFNDYTHRPIGHRWLWQVLFPSGKTNKNCAFSVLHTRRKIDRFYRSKKIFCVPTWIFGNMDLTSDIDTITKKNKSLKSNIRKLKKSNFKVNVSSDPLSLDEFYYKMYHPYISKRYGRSAIDMSYNRFKTQFAKSGEILFLEKDSQRIAGQMIYYEKDKAVAYELGIKDGNFQWVQQGAITALYLHTFNYCKSKGIKKLSLGGSRPFISDGVLNYKLTNWKMRINRYSKKFYFLIKQHRPNKFTQDFLCNNPFISLNNGEMMINTFYQKSGKEKNATIENKTKYIKYGLPIGKINWV